MKKVTQISAVLLMAAAAINGCKPDQDLTPPQIESIALNQEDSLTHTVNAGDAVDVVIHVSDNVSLKQMKINIHPADDGHGHGSSTGMQFEPNVGVWTTSKIIDLSGTSAYVNYRLEIPSDIKGHWHLEVLTLDESGNEAEEAFTTMRILNAELPVAFFAFNPTLSAVDSLIHISAANPQFQFNADITDADGLESIFWSVYTEDGILVDAQMLDGAGLLNMTTGDIQVILPGLGRYDWTFRATDQNGFYNEWVQEIIVE